MNTYVWVFIVFAGFTLFVLAMGWAVVQVFGLQTLLFFIGAAGLVGLLAVIIEWITEKRR